MYICRPSSTQLVVFDCVYAHQINSLVLNNTAISLHNIIVPYTCHSNQVRIIAEWRARASEARSVSALYSRFRDICIYIYIYIYIYVCLHMHCTRPCTPYASPITSAHCALSFGTLAAVRSTTLRSQPL